MHESHEGQRRPPPRRHPHYPSEVAKLADYNLYIAANESLFRNGAMSSRLAPAQRRGHPLHRLRQPPLRGHPAQADPDPHLQARRAGGRRPLTPNKPPLCLRQARRAAREGCPVFPGGVGGRRGAGAHSSRRAWASVCGRSDSRAAGGAPPCGRCWPGSRRASSRKTGRSGCTGWNFRVAKVEILLYSPPRRRRCSGCSRRAGAAGCPRRWSGRSPVPRAPPGRGSTLRGPWWIELPE